jgi:hypothetical protein
MAATSDYQLFHKRDGIFARSPGSTLMQDVTQAHQHAPSSLVAKTQ